METEVDEVYDEELPTNCWLTGKSCVMISNLMMTPTTAIAFPSCISSIQIHITAQKEQRTATFGITSALMKKAISSSGIRAPTGSQKSKLKKKSTARFIP